MLGDILLNRYSLEAQLGQGGMGMVYRGHDLLLNRTVAVKVLANAALGTAGKARLLSEARAVAGLNHPNIVTVYDAGEVGEISFIVMELVPGQDLRHYKPQSLSEILEIACQVCAALEHAHAAGVIHRDLKLENITLTPTKTVKLMDFGLARSREGPRLTEDGALMGTFQYMAPELLIGQKASAQSDLYALGVMLYELICGQPPFQGDDPLALASQHLHASPVPPSTHNPYIPLELESLILRLLAKQPDDRPASAAEVCLILERHARPGEAVTPPALQRAPLDRMVRGRLVGRARELAEAIQAWDNVQQGDSGVLLISGEPGVGKSRLARELTVQVQMASGMPLVGECYAGGNAPYDAFAQIILNTDGSLADLPQLVLADLISLAPALRVRFPEVPLNPSLEPAAEQQRLYESAFTFFARLARRNPLLLVIEDVHWADGGTLALVSSLARRFRQTRTPVLIVLTFREGELAAQKGLEDLLIAWNRERVAMSLKLHRLDRQGTRDLLEALFAETVSVEFADGIYRETEGNPFFIEELCKSLIEGGQVYRENGRWQRKSMSSIEMPRSIRRTIETRLAGLPQVSQEVLHLAAVLGRRFEFDMLQATYVEVHLSDPGLFEVNISKSVIFEQEEDTLILALEQAEEAQLLQEVGRGGGGTFEFAHALIPTTLVEGISKMRRRRLHRRVVTALQKIHPEDYMALAHHCLEASEDELALDYLIKAAQRARTAFANAEAVTNYQQAIHVLSELLHEKVQVERWNSTALLLYENLGDVLELTGQHEQAWTAYQNALVMVPSGESLRQSRLYRRIGKTRETQRQYDDADQAYLQAEAALGQAPADATMEWFQEWISLQLDRIFLYYWPGRIQEMTELVDKVRPVLERYGTPLQRSMFYGDLVMMAERRDRYVISEETLHNAVLALSAAEQVGDLAGLVWHQFMLGFVYLWQGNLEKAEENLLKALAITERIGDVITQSRCLSYLAITYRKRGDVQRVLSYATQSLEVSAIGQMIEYTSMAQGNLAWVKRREGKILEAQKLAEEAWETFQYTPQAGIMPWVVVWPLVSIYLEQKRLAEALDFTPKLIAPTAHPQPETIETCLQAAIRAWGQGQPEEANAVLTQAAMLAEPLGYI